MNRKSILLCLMACASSAQTRPHPHPKTRALPTPLAPTYSLAATTTQLTSSLPSPLTGQPTTLTATVTPGPGTPTSAGPYVPGPPSGLITFTDGTTPLGSAPLLATTLTFGAGASQTITAPSKVSGPSARPALRPNLTPSPDLSSGFTSLTADFNRDGLPDALVLDANSGTMHVLLGTAPAGNFQPDQPIHTPTPCFTGVTVADLNGDTFPDIAYLCPGANNTTALFVLFNNGDGSFAAPVPIRNGEANILSAGAQLGSGDLNHDGIPDLIVTGPTSPNAFGIQTFFGDGTGNFTVGPITPTFADPGTQLVVTDLNHDGAADLVLFQSSPQTYTTVVQPYRNDGTGTFTPTPAIQVCSCFTFASKLFVTPLTANPAYPDIAVAFPDQQQILVALNQQTAALTFATPTTQSIPNLTDALLGDFNGDGLPDLAVFNASNITLLNGDGTGTFTAQPSSPNFTSTGYPTAGVSLAAAADFNQDGYADLLTIYPGAPFTSTVNAYLTTGTAAASLPATFSTASTHTLTATYPGNIDLLASTGTLSLTVRPNQSSTILTYAPTPSTITYGTRLTALQLNATATTAAGATIPGAFAYNHAAGDLLPAGAQPLTVLFTPADPTAFTPATLTATLTVLKATPTLAFPAPPTAIVGTPLSALQLTPTITGIAGPNLPGTLTFTPTTGLVLAGPQTLTLTFTPTDTADYNSATATVTLTGIAVTLTALSATTASLGDPAKTITLTGTGFLPNSSARANGAALTTTYLNPTTLTAVLPAAGFLTLQTLQITVFDPTQAQTTSALPFTVLPAAVGTITVTAPTTANSGDQPTIRFVLPNPYPVDLTATLTLTFSPLAGTVDDPAIQFKGGGRTASFNLPAGQTASPAIQFQSGTVAGTIRVTLILTLTNGGANVTPSSVTPTIITIAPAAPAITSLTLTRAGRQLTVNIFGLSNTRAITQASFHFTPASGQQIQTQDIPLDVTSLFAGWYSQPVSATYGSTFLYTQTFILDSDASVVGQVTLTLANGVGISASGSSN